MRTLVGTPDPEPRPVQFFRGAGTWVARSGGGGTGRGLGGGTGRGLGGGTGRGLGGGGGGGSGVARPERRSRRVVDEPTAAALTALGIPCRPGDTIAITAA